MSRAKQNRESPAMSPGVHLEQASAPPLAVPSAAAAERRRFGRELTDQERGDYEQSEGDPAGVFDEPAEAPPVPALEQGPPRLRKWRVRYPHDDRLMSVHEAMTPEEAYLAFAAHHGLVTQVVWQKDPRTRQEREVRQVLSDHLPIIEALAD